MIHVREGHAPPSALVLDEPDIAHYLSGFGREGDDAQPDGSTMQVDQSVLRGVAG